MKRKWWVVLAALAFWGVSSTPVLACDDHVGKCDIEAWRGYKALGDIWMIEGSATCEKGEIKLRLYDDVGGEKKFLGVTDGYINGHAFQAMVQKIGNPASLSIRFSIEPGD